MVKILSFSFAFTKDFFGNRMLEVSISSVECKLYLSQLTFLVDSLFALLFVFTSNQFFLLVELVNHEKTESLFEVVGVLERFELASFVYSAPTNNYRMRPSVVEKALSVWIRAPSWVLIDTRLRKKEKVISCLIPLYRFKGYLGQPLGWKQKK